LKHRVNRLCNHAAPADDRTDVVFLYLQVKLREVAVLDLGHHHRRRILDERLGDVLEKRAHLARLPISVSIALTHRTDAGTSPSGMPLRIRRERVVAVGLAPTLNQWRARSAFTTRLAGSARGS